MDQGTRAHGRLDGMAGSGPASGIDVGSTIKSNSLSENEKSRPWELIPRPAYDRTLRSITLMIASPTMLRRNCNRAILWLQPAGRETIAAPTLIMHGDDDQIVPYADSAPLSAKLVKGAVLKTYKGFPHGMPTTNADEINADLLEFIKGEMAATA